MAEIYQMESCAMQEIHGLPDTGKAGFQTELFSTLEYHGAVIRIEEEWNSKTDEYDETVEIDGDSIPAFYIFKQALGKGVKTKGWGERFADWIENEGLGVVSRSESRENPGHSTKVTVFVWAINRKALFAYLEKNYLKYSNGR